MNGRAAQIGFSQRIRLEWLEKTAELLLAGNDSAAVYAALEEMLLDKVSVNSRPERGNRDKTITILMKTWLRVPRSLEALRDDGLNLLRNQDQHGRVAVCWGMATAAYPFWGAVASQTGRLLRLQGVAAAAQVQRRIREGYGDRPTVSRAARRVLRSFVDWSVLKDTATKGVYEQGDQHPIAAAELVAWVVEAILHGGANGAAPMRDLLDHPGLFPFRLMHVAAGRLVSLSPRLDLLRHGLDEDLVMLREA